MINKPDHLKNTKPTKTFIKASCGVPLSPGTSFSLKLLVVARAKGPICNIQSTCHESHYVNRAWNNPQGVATGKIQWLSVGLLKFLAFYKVLMVIIRMITAVWATVQVPKDIELGYGIIGDQRKEYQWIFFTTSFFCLACTCCCLRNSIQYKYSNSGDKNGLFQCVK